MGKDDPQKPRGRAIVWTEEDLDAMTTPEAMMAGAKDAAEWARDNSPQLAELLDATEEDDG